MEGVWLVGKIFVVIGLVVYILFAVVVLRQVGQMTDTLEVGFEDVIRIGAWIHLFFAIGTLIVAIVIL